MLTVFDCGQGDAIKLKPNGCYWEEVPLYIDLGPATFRQVIQDAQFDLLLTHCHDDHIQGSTIPPGSAIRDLYVPAYLPEYYKIMDKLKVRMPKVPYPRNRTVLVYDGYSMGDCVHNIVLNPPLDPRVLFSIARNIQDETIDGEVNNFLARYETSIDDILNSRGEFGEHQFELPAGYQARNFVRMAVYKVALKRASTLELAIKRYKEHDSNRLSVVFKYQDMGRRTSLLLTGDADKSVFRRLMKRKANPLDVDVLKVPHHGSKGSLNQKILNVISPKIAIFSHDNGIFGTSTDPHPHDEVLKYVSKVAGCASVFTNDVVKNGKRLHKGTGDICIPL